MNYVIPERRGKTDGTVARSRPCHERRWLRLASAFWISLLLIGAVGVGILFHPNLGRLHASRSGAPRSGAAFARVSRQELNVTLRARGNVESYRNSEGINEVEGQTTIIHLLPEGTEVKKGQLVCELDSSTLDDSLTNEIITVRQADADLQGALETRRVAEAALKEYVGGTYPSDMEAAQDALAVAKSNLALAVAKYEWSCRMIAKGYVTETQNMADRDSKIQCEIDLANAETKVRVLQSYTRARNLTELQAAIYKAQSDELAKRLVLDRERTKQRKLETQIAKCKMYAPADGLLTYVNDDVNRPGTAQTLVEEGATARERQHIFRLPDVTHMRINTKIHESLMGHVGVGNKSRIRLDALPGQVLAGSVVKLQPIAEPSQPPTFDIHVYTCLIDIDVPPSSLRPGMSAEAELLTSQLDDVLTVPAGTVLSFRDRHYVYVAGPKGAERRQVRLGLSNDRAVEVCGGVREGELVSLAPLSLMSEQEKHEAFILENGIDGTEGATASETSHP